jgi:cytochrome c oxidase cbb3-type subunit 3
MEMCECKLDIAANIRRLEGEMMRPLKLPHLEIVASTLILISTSAFGQFANPIVVPASASRGASIYSNSCAKCHGVDARGTEAAPDLIRSTVVLHDRLNSLHGSEMATVLKTGPNHNFNLDKEQLLDLSQFLVQSVNKILRSGYSNQPTNLLSGDMKAGEAYFNGTGGCVKCHSATGDLAGVGKRYDPPTLQQKFLFPNSGGRGLRTSRTAKKVQVTVSLPSGKSFSGTLVRIDDFTVAFRDEAGVYHSFLRSGGVKVTTVDPYAAHVALLDKYTDMDIHNLTTYMETLK